MILKRHKYFILEKKDDKWIYEGYFKVTSEMVDNGTLIKEMIPDEVTGNFNCSNNQLTSLEGCPSTVGGDFNCDNNKLTNFQGCPSTVSGSFYCSYNKLTSLQGCPSAVGGNFNCFHNQLTSLEGCPSTVGGDFYCHYNQLTTLQHCPSTIDGNFNCFHNQLTSLEGCPSTIGGSFNCNNNLLDLTIEKEFIMSGSCSSQENYGRTNAEAYWVDLLKYMINKKIDLDKITTWPKGFLNLELINSVKGIAKFNL